MIGLLLEKKLNIDVLLRESMSNEVDHDKIKQIISYNTDNTVNGLNALIDQWSDNKLEIFKLFNNKLVQEIQIEGFLDDYEIRDSLANFTAFIEEFEVFSQINILLKIVFTVDEVKQNKILHNNNRSTLKESFPHFSTGMKLSKFLRKCIQTDRKIEYKDRFIPYQEFFDIKYSEFLQELKSSGTIYASINPIDFLTMSVNNSGWSSCHNLEKDNIHRAGIFSYMTDKVSIILYRLSQSEPHSREFGTKVNNKTWRQVGFLDIKNKSAILSREYPSRNLVNSEFARILIATLLGEYHNVTIEPNKKYVKWSKTSNLDKIRNNIADKVELHYNDIIYYNDTIASQIIVETGSEPNILVGNEPICPSCGIDDITIDDEIECNDCSEHLPTCYVCENNIDENNIRTHTMNIYCEDCFHEHFIYCHQCGDYEPINNSTYVDSAEEWICEWCLNNHYTRCAECGEHHHNNDMHYSDDKYEHYCESCYYETHEQCEECETNYHNDNLEYNEYVDMTLCVDCNENIEIDEGEDDD